MDGACERIVGRSPSECDVIWSVIETVQWSFPRIFVTYLLGMGGEQVFLFLLLDMWTAERG